MPTLFRFFVWITLTSSAMNVTAQTIDTLPLYSNSIPNAKNCGMAESDIHTKINHVVVPTLTVFLPKKQDANKASVIICPGGGYGGLAINHEGFEVARALNNLGITAFVLKYRLPKDACMQDKSIGPLQDAQQSIALVRSKSETFNIDPNKIGILGFSAGGHLAATATTHFSQPVLNVPVSVKPDFAVLIYSVISFADSITHMGSRRNLLGSNPTAAMIAQYSNELHITSSTPPCFLVHAADDKAVVVDNSLSFFKALKKQQIPASLNIYPFGGHGFGLHNKTTSDQWFNRLTFWLKDQGFLRQLP
jgi:acetyl esterase/lipase